MIKVPQSEPSINSSRFVMHKDIQTWNACKTQYLPVLLRYSLHYVGTGKYWRTLNVCVPLFHNFAQAEQTRSSADADNRLDAFISGQSSPWRRAI